MSVVTTSSTFGLYEPAIGDQTMAELVARLGDVPLHRIRSKPAPGTATDADLLELAERHGILCELVDGVLVEKPMGIYESRLAQIISHLLESYLDHNSIGITAGESGPVRTTPKQVRMPDVSFVLSEHVTLEMVRTQKVLEHTPDLAVEVLSESNTKREMSRKLREYFEAGTRLVWYVDPEAETIQVFRAPEDSETISGEQHLTGGDLLPNFAVKVADIFARAKQGFGGAEPIGQPPQ